MDDYNKYVTAVNKIFDYISKMRIGWNNIDNINYLDSLEEFKNAVTTNADAFKQAPDPALMVNEEETQQEPVAQPQNETEQLAEQQAPQPPEPVQKLEDTPTGQPETPIQSPTPQAQSIPNLAQENIQQQVAAVQPVQVPSIPQLNTPQATPIPALARAASQSQ